MIPASPLPASQGLDATAPPIGAALHNRRLSSDSTPHADERRAAAARERWSDEGRNITQCPFSRFPALIGLSHVLRPRVWVEFFIVLRERGEAGVFAVGTLNLIFGSIIVAFHNRWTGIPLVLTVVGWANVVKAVIYFTLPAFGLRKLRAL